MITWLLGAALAVEIPKDVEFDIGLSGHLAYFVEMDTDGGFSVANPIVGIDFGAQQKDNWLVGLMVAPDSDLGVLGRLAGQLGWKRARLSLKTEASHPERQR